MPHQRTLAAPAAAHNNENITAVNRKRQIPLDHKAAIGHGEVLDDYVGLRFRHLLSFTLNVGLFQLTGFNIGSYTWFQVSGVRCQQLLIEELRI
jgi:hypothetical protein